MGLQNTSSVLYFPLDLFFLKFEKGVSLMKASLVKEGICVSIPEITPKNIKKMRKRMGLTQVTFSAKYGISLGTLRNWEQKSRKPCSIGRAFLKILFFVAYGKDCPCCDRPHKK